MFGACEFISFFISLFLHPKLHPVVAIPCHGVATTGCNFGCKNRGIKNEMPLQAPNKNEEGNGERGD